MTTKADVERALRAVPWTCAYCRLPPAPVMEDCRLATRHIFVEDFPALTEAVWALWEKERKTTEIVVAGGNHLYDLVTAERDALRTEVETLRERSKWSQSGTPR